MPLAVPLLALASVLWVAILVVAPLAPTAVAVVLYGMGAAICHQMPDRSFHAFGAQLPVCARCSGIYGGAAVAGVLAAWGGTPAIVRRATVRAGPRTLLTLGAFPTASTVLLEWAGLWPGSNLLRAAAGSVLGFAVMIVVGRAAATLHYVGCAPRRPSEPSPPTPI